MKRLRDIIQREFLTISGSYAILLVLLGGVFVYGLLYNYMYEPDVVRNAPVAVVDRSQTSLSREYVRLLDATPGVSVYAAGIDYPAAKELMKRNLVIGIIYLPFDFERRTQRGEESMFMMYGSTNTFLYFLALQESASGAMLALNDRCRSDMLVFLPQQAIQSLVATHPITVVGTALYNPTEGYGSYLIPAVLMVIIFQTLLMVIGMISGDEHSSQSIRWYGVDGSGFFSMSRVVIGKTVVYLGLYGVFAVFLLGLMPVVFNLPRLGNTTDLLLLMLPYLLATSFFGLTASLVFTDSEAPLLMIAFFSVGLIFLSGVSYPLELMPWYWQWVHYMIPTAPATLAFVKINSMGASLWDIRVELITLCVQCFVYFITAGIVYGYRVKQEAKRATDVQ